MGLVAPTPTYSVVQKFPVAGEGGWDYLSVDSDSHRLFISRGTHLQVMDTETGTIVGDVLNTPGVHGAAVVPKLGKGYTSNGRDDSVTVFDLKTFKELKKVKVGSRPDAILYDPSSMRVFTFNAGSTDATAIDVKTDSVVGSVKLDGKPETPQVDGKGTLFVNIEDKSEIQEFDTKALKVTGGWPVAPGEEPSGLAYDGKRHLLFSTCSNNIFAISDTKAKKVVATPKIGNGPDAASCDPALGLAFSSNGQDGTLTVVGQTASGSWDVIATVPTQTTARTMALDPKTHRIYLIAAQVQPAPAGQAQGRRRQMVPGSTTILVVAPSK
jgi:YVTN family beta-propeller protein